MGDECLRTMVTTTRLLERFPHVRVRRETTHPYRRERQSILVAGLTNTASLRDLYRFAQWPIWDCCRECCPLFIVLRHYMSSSPISLSEVIHKLFALSRVFLLSCGGKSVLLTKKKAPSRSGILLSMHVVLKTRHVNPNIHVRRY